MFMCASRDRDSKGAVRFLQQIGPLPPKKKKSSCSVMQLLGTAAKAVIPEKPCLFVFGSCPRDERKKKKRIWEPFKIIIITTADLCPSRRGQSGKRAVSLIWGGEGICAAVLESEKPWTTHVNAYVAARKVPLKSCSGWGIFFFFFFFFFFPLVTT